MKKPTNQQEPRPTKEKKDKDGLPIKIWTLKEWNAKHSGRNK